MPDDARTHAARTHPARTHAARTLAALALVLMVGCATPGSSTLVVSAGPDRSVAVGATVALDGGGSTGALTYAWTFVERPSGSGATLANAATAEPTFVADAPGTFRVRLLASNGPRSAEDEVVVTAVEAAGVLLEGDPDDRARQATYDLTVPAAYPPGAFALDPSGATVLLREVEVGWTLEASVAAVNDLLQRYDATIVGMLGGVPASIVRVPDPGGWAGLQDLLERLRAEPAVATALPSWVLVPPSVTDPDGDAGGVGRAEIPMQIPLTGTRLQRIDHHLAVRGHAAWNARAALDDAGLPWLVILDFFGDGAPVDGYAGTYVAGDFGTGAVSMHGYHVLGIVQGAFAPDPQVIAMRRDVTGMMPADLPVRAVDLSMPTINTSARMRSTAIQRINAILALDPDARIVVNSSIGSATPGTSQRAEGEAWTVAVRLAGESALDDDATRAALATPGSGLEDRFLHATSAGNSSTAGTVAFALNNGGFTYAALGTDMTALDVAMPPLRNVLVVENRVRTRHDPATPERPAPTCASVTSTMGGSISAIGTDVWSMGRCTAWNTQGRCITEFSTNASDASGTSMSTPQVAALAAYAWALAPFLDAPQVRALLLETAVADTPDATAAECNPTPPQPVIDAYAAVLAAGAAAAWDAILDVTGDGAFDEADLAALLDGFAFRTAEGDFGRFDLNGDGVSGSLARTERVDLNGDRTYGTAVRTILSTPVTYDEAAVSDYDVLCYFAYGPLYDGTPGLRDGLMARPCLGTVVRIESPRPAADAPFFGEHVARADVFDPRAPGAPVAPSGTTVRWSQPLRDGRVVDVATTLPSEAIEIPTYCRAAELTAEAWRNGAPYDRDTVTFEGTTRTSRATTIASPSHDPIYLNALLADATVELLGSGFRIDCDGETPFTASQLQWTLDASTAVLGTGTTFAVRAGDLPASGTTFRLRYRDGLATNDRRTMIPCFPFEGLGPVASLRPCSNETMVDRVRDALAAVLAGRAYDDAAQARDDLQNALREAWIGPFPDPFPIGRFELVQQLVAIVGEGEATPFVFLLNLADDPDLTIGQLRDELLTIETDAGARFHENAPVLNLLLTATQTQRATLQTFAPTTDDGGAGAGWGHLRFATTQERASASPLPAARATTYAFLTAFVSTYAGERDFGASPLVGYDEALVLEVAALAGVEAVVAALADGRAQPVVDAR